MTIVKSRAYAGGFIHTRVHVQCTMYIFIGWYRYVIAESWLAEIYWQNIGWQRYISRILVN